MLLTELSLTRTCTVFNQRLDITVIICHKSYFFKFYSDYVTLYYFDQFSLLKLASDSWKLVQLVNSDVWSQVAKPFCYLTLSQSGKSSCYIWTNRYFLFNYRSRVVVALAEESSIYIPLNTKSNLILNLWTF